MLTILGWRRPGKISNAYTDKRQAFACRLFFVVAEAGCDLAGSGAAGILARGYSLMEQNQLRESTILFAF